MAEIDGDGDLKNNPVFRKINYTIFGNEDIRREMRRYFRGNE